MCLAPRREQVMGQMIFVVLPAVVLAKENLDAMPRALDCVSVITGNRIAELDAVIDSMVLVTQRPEIMIRSPAITNDLCAGFDPVTYYCQKCVGGSVLDGNKKCLSGLSLYTAKHPMTLNRVSPMIFSPTELALVNFDGFIRTTDFNGAALQVHQHNFPAEHAPVCECMRTEAIFALDLVRLFAADDAVR